MTDQAGSEKRSIKVSVVTAVFNAAKTINQALSSVTGQVGANIEHIVIDGGSSDGTLDILRANQHTLGVLVSEPDRGIYDALNKGICHASGDVVGFLHSDDFYAHQHVVAGIAAAFEDARIDVVYGDLDYVQRQDPSKILRHWESGRFSRRALSMGWMPPHPTLYVRRSLYERVGGFDTTYRIASDYEFILRILSIPGIRVAYIPEVLVKMRTGGASNRSLGNILRKSQEDYRALRSHGVGGVATLALKNARKVPQFLLR